MAATRPFGKIFGWVTSRLCLFFDKIHDLDTFKHLSVSDQMSKGWDMCTLRRIPRDVIEQEQWDRLLSITQNIQLQSIPNRLRWIIDTSDTFYVYSTRGYIDDNILFYWR